MNQPFVFGKDCPAQKVGEGLTRKLLAHGKDLMAVEVSFEAGAAGAPHSHPHTQLTYVLEGEFEFEIDGVKSVVRKGDTLFKLPNARHGCRCLKKGALLDTFTPCREDFLPKG